MGIVVLAAYASKQQPAIDKLIAPDGMVAGLRGKEGISSDNTAKNRLHEMLVSGGEQEKTRQ